MTRPGRDIWIFTLGYFVAYVPFSMLAKGVSKGLFSADGKGLDGPVLLPVSMIFSVAVMFTFWALNGWWRDAARARPFKLGPLLLPRPRRGTWLSGVCVAGISATTTLAFTFEGVSIVLALLLMRGGVLLMGPLVDGALRRGVRAEAWQAFTLTLAALLLSLSGATHHHIPGGCVVVLGVYLACYLTRLVLMTRLAKGPDPVENRRFLIEEQVVGNSLLVVGLVAMALLGIGGVGAALRQGFAGLWSDPGLVAALLAMGFCSAGTGMFGSLVFLDARENTFCIPVNRASSLLAGVVATFVMHAIFASGVPRRVEIVGTILVCGALIVAAAPSLTERRNPDGAPHS